MTEQSDKNNDGERTRRLVSWGLCATCTHRREVTSERGSVFVMCELSKTDPRFVKYPRLPVVQCAGFEAND